MTLDLHETAAARLRSVNQRYTASRRALVEVLSAGSAPSTIPEMLASRPGAPQSSTYRNLAVLEQAGVVRRLVTNDAFARFELAEDLTEHHHHLVCSVCGAVDDFSAPPAVERSLARVMADVASSSGFRAEYHRLDLIGTCARCDR